jgi:flagellar L-ring protein precursor FlgH
MKATILVGLWLVTAATTAAAQHPLWDAEAGGSLFSNIKAHRVGDILTVIVSENSSASSDAKTETTIEHDISGGPGEGILDFIPLWGVQQKTDYEGEGKTERKGKLSAVMSVRIVEELPGEQFRIEGARAVKRNGETETMSLRGTIRQRDISPDNTIRSSMIADAEISYDGEGDVARGNEPGFLTRLVAWFF